MNFRKIILIVAVAMLSAGCVQVTPPGEETLSVTVPQGWGTGSVSGSPADGWIESFGDEGLSAVMAEALSGNLQLQAALSRLEQAEALARIEGADRWPDLSLSGSASRQMSNNLIDPPVRTRSDRFGLDAVVSWELDLWGRVRARALAANADAEAAQADYAALRLSIASRVANAWFATIAARRQEALALETVTSFEANLTTVQERFERGLSPALDLRLTRANVANARATQALQKRLADSSARQLEVLLGRYPSATVSVSDELPVLLEPVPAGLPSELLLRRPDILGSANRLMAADARLKESKRALLPAIRLTGSYGRASNDLDNILKDSFDVWSLLGNITAPLFQGGRLRANVDRSDARLNESVANYRDTVLTAFREVESALAGEAYLQQQLEALQVSVEESTGAQELAEERYERGLVDIITVLESQRRAFNARSAYISLQNELLQNRLALYLALGGNIR
ncbi:efflux transporter outer membrane subunit [Puniceicoccales bacterium CK1056]|uniref:Efflux transporter outer membrane subunit n=1 Tax=Oceanipulchritudo coccoides TaxID=2706888 RepID=A0A6B2LZI0_9BACT|nr:efflux transporter outer membrane subunit [Oceanipulchritudo coccoides]NDV60905.1 efflux transporter outer membrane subunit [Oceanipulchritudo coccoides]